MPAAAAAAATAGGMAESKSELLRSTGGSGGGGTTKLAAALSGTAARPSAQVSWAQMQKFLFPSNLEHPESTGRLMLFAKYGPVDENGRLHGGRGGKHVHTDAEIRLMIKNETTEALYGMFTKPRDTVELIVEQLLPVALRHNYTQSEIKRMLKEVPLDSDAKMDYACLQELILENEEKRLQMLVKGGAKAIIKERGAVVPYQSKPAEKLLAITKRRPLTHQEEQVATLKKLSTGCTLIAGLEEQSLTKQMQSNVQLIRGLGPVSDRWDRYCSLRKSGKASYVEAKNELRPSDYYFDNGSLKHRGCSNLESAGLL